MSKYKPRYTVVDKHRLAALEHNDANAHDFGDVVRKGLRIGFTIGIVFGAIISNLIWILVSYL